jgi:hypothetical protein
MIRIRRAPMAMSAMQMEGIVGDEPEGRDADPSYQEKDQPRVASTSGRFLTSSHLHLFGANQKANSARISPN